MLREDIVLTGNYELFRDKEGQLEVVVAQTIIVNRPRQIFFKYGDADWIELYAQMLVPEWGLTKYVLETADLISHDPTICYYNLTRNEHEAELSFAPKRKLRLVGSQPEIMPTQLIDQEEMARYMRRND